ncbi:MAG TPA: tRNA guanosine(34) transglycosylase Tgt [Leptospiraceae bacterium]|nr:tRNA guanosine(34) transglycosylase Tgt [Leptospiraceae bacterium]HMY66647.1 tRNA guanosine(34) transglycosylase Tgt [Leptospiraceae bacterium]HMZ59644.1 tRNA guanosine(34) transglycosylase Tgt [Leptospiraceae bacterium]HNF15764.1 tRNA guanosine(34) transglycosylase Tgt [Leptospiraceae bacterium]HNF24282.1 tRNA guanosine(34) transglycosylase Tgt [Leptospiraceae bacterium]
MNKIFQETSKDSESLARTGILSLNGVTVPTPVFMPVGTRGSIKALSSEDIDELELDLILANTYHIYLRPGTEILQKMGGLKKFMSYPRAMLTDSGGFQVFSLGDLFKFHSDGVYFKSHIDGSKHEFTPSKVIDIQRIIGSDIMMPLDDCAPYGSDRKRLELGLERTHRWAESSVEYWEKNPNGQSLFAIAQGGVDKELRIKSLQFMNSLPFPGIAVGGLSVGETRGEFLQMLETLGPHFDGSRPRYLMGVGTIPDILDGVRNGIDMFDCVLPTRNARNGQVFTSKGKINLRNEIYKDSERPIDEECDCRVCRRYSLGYIRHLHKVKEILGLSLSTFHTLYFMQNFMKKLRMSIEAGEFNIFYEKWKKLYS